MGIVAFHSGIPCIPCIYPCGVQGTCCRLGSFIIFLPVGPVVCISLNRSGSSIFLGFKVCINFSGSLILEFCTCIFYNTHISFHHSKHGDGVGFRLHPGIFNAVIAIYYVNVGIVTAVGKYALNAYCLWSSQCCQSFVKFCHIEPSQLFLQGNVPDFHFSNFCPECGNHGLVIGNHNIQIFVVVVVQCIISCYNTFQVLYFTGKAAQVGFQLLTDVGYIFRVCYLGIPQILSFSIVQVYLCFSKGHNNVLNLESKVIQSGYKILCKNTYVGQFPLFKRQQSFFIGHLGCKQICLKLGHGQFPLSNGCVCCGLLCAQVFFHFFNFYFPAFLMEFGQCFLPFRFCLYGSCLGINNGFMSQHDCCLGLNQGSIRSFYLCFGLYKSGLSSQQSSLCITHSFNALARLILNTANSEYT